MAGDREALAQLLVDHSGPLTRRLSARMQLNPFVDFAVEDVLQEVFLDVDRGIGTFSIDSGTSFAAWLKKVADNRLAAMLRERSRLKRGGGRRQVRYANQALQESVSLLVNHLAADDDTASAHAARADVIDAVRAGLATLPSEQRTAVEQIYLDQRSLESAADEMQKTGGAMRGLLYRAKNAMRDALGESSRWFDRK